MFNVHDIKRNAFMLNGPLAHRGYDWWWHSFTARNEKTGEEGLLCKGCFSNTTLRLIAI